MLDIIIPVYNAHDDLVRCIDSVLATATGDWRLLLINDASPDPRIAPLVARYASEHPRIRALINEQNRGFIGTVNRGFAETSGDVVLLNSDTIVTRGWLDKIRLCAASDDRIATITPFSNNAEICSYPEMCGNHDWVPGDDPEIYNDAIAVASRREYPEQPTGVGFCMYIRRATLDAIGEFDMQYGLGYGEENDFCRRLVQAGYRNVLLDDTFVAHVGNRSFDAKKAALVERNSQLLVSRFPDYPRIVQEFIAADRPRSTRLFARSVERVLRPQGRPGVLHILHGRGGGTEHHVDHLIEAMPQYRHYIMVALGDRWEIDDLADGLSKPIKYAFTRKDDELWASYLREIADVFAIGMVHVHHLSGARVGLLMALAGAAIPYGVTVHDFHLACPTITLMDATDRFCGGETDPAVCTRCLDAQPPLRDIRIVEWRRSHGEFMGGARFLIAPSKSVADILARYYPPHGVHVVPHDKPQATGVPREVVPKFALPDDGVPVVAILGAIGPVKGARNVEKLVQLTRSRRIPIRWVLIGYLDRQYQPVQDRDFVFTLTGPYHPDDIPALLDHFGARITVFPSAGPETFSYTLTESFASGRPALVPPVGALGERVAATGGGWLMDDWQRPEAILDQLVRILSPANADDVARASANAARAAVTPAGRMGAMTGDIYSGVAMEVPAMPKIADKDRVYRALETVRGLPSTPVASVAAAAASGWVTRAAHVAIRFRYTRPGRWVARSLPPSWQRRLKARLLGSS